MYWLYIKSLGVTLTCGMFVFFLLAQVASIFSNVWLSEWTSDPLLKNATLSNTSRFSNRQNLFLGIYGAFSGAQGRTVYILHMCLIYCRRWLKRNSLESDVVVKVSHSQMVLRLHTRINFHLAKLLAIDVILYHTAFLKSFRNLIVCNFGVCYSVIK